MRWSWPARRARTGIAVDDGQATVELVAVLPLVAAVALGAGQLLAAGAARELAGTAAQAGAMALQRGADPVAAARSALPGWSRDAVRVRRRGARVVVRLRPVELVPGTARLLEARAELDAGPAL